MYIVYNNISDNGPPFRSILTHFIIQPPFAQPTYVYIILTDRKNKFAEFYLVRKSAIFFVKR